MRHTKRLGSKKLSSSLPRWKIISLSALVAFAAVTAGGATATNLTPGISSTASVALKNQLGLSSDACSTAGTASFKVTNGAPSRSVFKLSNVWHKNNPCLEALLNKASNAPSTTDNTQDDIHDFMYYQMLYILSRSDVRFDKNSSGKNWKFKDVINKNEKLSGDFTHIIYTGENNQPYDGMGQADFADWALRAHEVTLKKGSANAAYAEAYKKVALASAETLITPINKGGLRSRTKCSEKNYHCSWFHSKTNPGAKTENALTLNKHLHIVRDLKRISDKLNALGTNASKAKEFQEAALEGVNQLVYSKGIKDGVPNLFDYVPKKDDGKGIPESWAYYSFNGKGKGYFLSNEPAKNCGYHKRNLTLLVSIFQDLEGKIDRSGFRKTYGFLDGTSILNYMVQTFETKRDKYGLSSNTKTHKNGFFGSCNDTSNTEIGADLTASHITYLKNY